MTNHKTLDTKIIESLKESLFGKFVRNPNDNRVGKIREIEIVELDCGTRDGAGISIPEGRFVINIDYGDNNICNTIISFGDLNKYVIGQTRAQVRANLKQLEKQGYKSS